MMKTSKFLMIMAILVILSQQKQFAQGNLMYFQVTVNVSLSTGLVPVNVEVVLNNTYYVVTDSSGIIVFDSVTSGPFHLTAFKIGYDTYVLNNIFINEDKVFDIVLSEKKYTPTCLHVDPLSLEATWCKPLRTALDEDFENPEFPPAGWQALSEQVGWQRTDDGSSGGWTIPPWDSFYAMTNDDAAGGNGSGCCDYLITTAVDLRESEDYTLIFDSFYNGAYGQLAFVEYSVDGGDTWELMYQMAPEQDWTEIGLDLLGLCGPEGPEQIMFAFHADDAGSWASGWAIDNVKIQVPAPAANYLDFWVFLDDSLVGVTMDTNWNYAPLLYGQTYIASVAARYSSGLSSKDYYSFSCTYLFPPDSLTAYAPDDAAILQWYPPWEYWPPVISNVNPVDLEEAYCPPPITGQLPENLLGYNIYRDGDFVAYKPHTPPGEFVLQGYVDEDLWPGHYEYTITAVYDLAPFGYPGETDESLEEGPAEVLSFYCFELEFLETWTLGNFEDNYWIADTANWQVNSQVGNPSPAAEFSRDPVLTDYEASLTSFPLCAAGMTEGKIWLDFDLKLDAVQPTGEELIEVQIWNWESGEWATVAQYSNSEVSFDWTSEHVNIKAQAMDKVFKIRFHATGTNSASILGWFLDNIDVYRTCDGPTNLTAFVIEGQGIGLSWDMPGGSSVDEWIHWDDGVYSGISIGTGGAEEWDVAARWEPEQLVNYEGASVTEIAFFPVEPTTAYRVRVWIGAGAANLVCDQAVTPVCGEWNTVVLETPVPVDLTEELWVGYHVITPSGYPAGVDDGPAIDGYGNMMKLDEWQTLLQINPNLDYNWNISAHLLTVAGSRELLGYNIYRSVNGSAYALIDFTTEITYPDPASNLVNGTSYCYMVSAVWMSETDQCESAFSNEACVLWTSINDQYATINSFSLYPNPADDHVFITTSGELKHIKIYDALGRLVMDQVTTGKQYELSTAGYTIGVYMVRVETAEGVTTRTLTIQR